MSDFSTLSSKQINHSVEMEIAEVLVARHDHAFTVFTA